MIIFGIYLKVEKIMENHELSIVLYLIVTKIHRKSPSNCDIRD